MSSYSNPSQIVFNVSSKQESFLKQVDNVCKILRPYAEECYLQEKFNDRIIPEFAKVGMLGCPISRRYGIGYDILTYILALERIGREGSSMRTFLTLVVVVLAVQLLYNPNKSYLLVKD